MRYCRRSEADTVILDRIRDADRPSDLLVVTNDMEMALRAKQLHARHATVDEWFFEGGKVETPDDKPDPGGLSPDDFDLPKFVNLDHPPGDMRDE